MKERLNLFGRKGAMVMWKVEIELGYRKAVFTFSDIEEATGFMRMASTSLEETEDEEVKISMTYKKAGGTDEI